MLSREPDDTGDAFCSARLPARSAIIDFECVICDEKGVADFWAVRTALARGKAEHAFPGFRSEVQRFQEKRI